MFKKDSRNPSTRSLLSASVTAAVLGVSAPAMAEDFALEEVVVTAQKRAESLQDVSVSVSALGGDFMQDAGITDMNDVAQHVPALTVSTNSSPWNTSFRMRRIGNEGNIPTFEPDTGLFIDGAFRSRSGLGLGDLVDIERIEALKGPQSTLYGKNVTAGVISVTTTAPTQDFEAMVEATAAEDSSYNVKGFVNGGITDTVAGRMSLSYSERDHLVDNVAAGGDADDLQSYAIRGQLMFEPSDELSVRVIAGAVNRDFDGPVGDTEYDAATLALLTGLDLATGGTGTGVVTENTLGNRKIEFGQGVTEFEQDSYELTVIVDYDLGFASLTSTTSYDEYDVTSHLIDGDQTSLPIFSFEDTTEGHSWSQELRLTSPGGDTIDWMTGLFIYHNNFTRGDGTDQDFVFNMSPAGALSVLGSAGDAGNFFNEQDTDTYSIFGQATWNISDVTALTAGLRYTYEEKDAELSTSSNTAGALGFVKSLTPDNTWKPDDSWSFVTGNISLEHHWTDDVMTYFTIAHGAKSGGFNLGFGGAAAGAPGLAGVALPNDNRPFEEETVDTIELGWKSQFLDNRLQLNGAIFYTEYEDFQSAAYVGLSFNVDNAEQVNNYGIEFDGMYLLTEELTANFAVSYVKAEYDKYTRGSCSPQRLTPGVAPGFCDLAGEDLPFAPRWKANVGLQYEVEFNGGDFYARTDVSWVDKHTPSSSLDERHEQSDYALANIKFGWRNDNWDFSIWGKNITDQDYAIQYAPDNAMGALASAPALGGNYVNESHQVFMNPPSSFGATLRYTY